MLIEGKMSIGVRSRATGGIRRGRSEKTTNVYGRLRASFTIHMRRPLRCFPVIDQLCEASRVDGGRGISSSSKIPARLSSAAGVGLFAVGRYVSASVKPV